MFIHERFIHHHLHTPPPTAQVVVIPNYRIYPMGSSHDQADDVAMAIEWCKANIHQYSGDSSRITISGHSSGAHITSLALLTKPRVRYAV